MFATETGLTEVDRLGGGSLGYLCQFIAARGGLDPVIPSSYAYMWYDAAECPEQSISPVPDVSGAINTPWSLVSLFLSPMDKREIFQPDAQVYLRTLK